MNEGEWLITERADGVLDAIRIREGRTPEPALYPCEDERLSRGLGEGMQLRQIKTQHGPHWIVEFPQG